MPRLFTAVLSLLLLTGCSSHEKAPQLRSAAQLRSNVGQSIRVVGTARYLKASGPSVAGTDFEIRVYPTNAWGPELDGKPVEVTGRLNDTHSITPPDPSINPGEYWLSNATWTPQLESKP